MPKLKCEVGQCLYNSNHRCHRGSIDVEGPAARCKKDTACLSYVQKGNINYDVEFAKLGEAEANTYVYCDAVNCVFEHDSRCRADKIEIKKVDTVYLKYQDMESKYPDGHWKNATTMCKTFESKE